MSYSIRSFYDLDLARATCERNGNAKRAAYFAALIEVWRPVQAMEKARIHAERAASTLRAAAKLCPDLAEDLLSRAATHAAEQKSLRAEIGSACATIEAMRLP